MERHVSPIYTVPQEQGMMLIDFGDKRLNLALGDGKMFDILVPDVKTVLI